MTKERISEPISDFLVTKITNLTDFTIINFRETTLDYHKNISGDDHNLNYRINSLTVSYNLPSLVDKSEIIKNDLSLKPDLTDSEFDEKAKEVEFQRKYNESTNDNGKFHGIKLTLKLFKTTTQTIADVLLYNNGIRERMSLMPYLDTNVMSQWAILKAQVSSLGEKDEIIISVGYEGNINYTFDNGTQKIELPTLIVNVPQFED